MTVNELQQVINSAKEGTGSSRSRARQGNWKHRDILIITMLTQTGLRVTPLVEIDISDIDFKNKKLRVIQKGDKKHEFILDNRIMDRIDKWLEVRKEILGDKANTTDALFISN